MSTRKLVPVNEHGEPVDEPFEINEVLFRPDGTVDAPGVTTDEQNNEFHTARRSGPNDGVKDAIDAAGAGDTVVVDPRGGSGPNGEYLFTSAPVMDPPDNLTIDIREGADLKMADGQDLAAVLLFTNVAGLTIKGEGTVDANRQNNAGNAIPAIDLSNEDGPVTNASIEGITLDNTQRIAIRIRSNPSGAAADEIRDITVEDVWFKSNRSDTGDVIGHMAVAVTGSNARRVTVEDCLFDHPENGSGCFRAEPGCPHMTFRGNTILYDEGIHRGVALDGAWNWLIDNHFEVTIDTLPTAGDIVRLGQNGDHQLAAFNTFDGVSENNHGIVFGGANLAQNLFDVVALGNTVVEAGGAGIMVSGDEAAGNNPMGPRLIANTCLNCNQNGFTDNKAEAGIGLVACHKAEVLYNTLGDTQATATQNHPVYVDADCVDCRIRGGRWFGHADTNDPEDNGTRTVVNGEVAESANAEQPQASYPRPVRVNFTDTGDGSGDGIYYIDRSGGVHGPI